MAAPRIFVSSTCYDLKYIRENIKRFINDMGYDSILSEDGDVFYDPDIHTHDACLSEVQTCQIFVLIIGGRYGGNYREEDKSITNKEYEEAIKLKIPVFTLVEKNVLAEHFVYQKNKALKHADRIVYPSIDNIKIFSFIDEVRKNDTNNAIFPFGDYHDIENYLKKQWAGMVYNFLTNNIETKQVSDLFNEIHGATEKIEYYTKQVAMNVGDASTKALIKCYDVMLGDKTIQDLKISWGINVTPYVVLRIENVEDVCESNVILDDDSEGISITLGGPPYRCSKMKYDQMKEGYLKIRKRLFSILEEYEVNADEFLKNEGND